MSDSIRMDNAEQLNTNESKLTSVRATPSNTSFASTLKSGLARTIGVASYYVPGAAILSAAVNTAGTAMSTNSSQGSMAAPGGLTRDYNGNALGGAGSPLSGPGGIGNMSGAGGINPNSSTIQQTAQLQEMSQQFNLQYLTLQENMQAENRQYTALSNVMKTKHDTAKNALSNLK